MTPLAVQDWSINTMLGRPGTAVDVEGIMVFLASDDSAYATGGIFTVDGGLTAL